MSVAQPIPFITDTDVEQKRPPVKSTTFLIGPPTDQKSVYKLAGLAGTLGINPENFWVEIVHGKITEFLETGIDGRSRLDGIVSEALGEPVSVWGVEEALHVVAKRHFLALTIRMEDVLDADGSAVGVELADREVCGGVARPLMDATCAGWSVCTVTRPDTEVVFVYLAGTEEPRT